MNVYVHVLVREPLKKVEQQIWGTITAAANETYTKQYVATWQQISKPVLAPSFDLEVWDFCFF